MLVSRNVFHVVSALQSIVFIYHGLSHKTVVFSWHAHQPLGLCINYEDKNDSSMVMGAIRTDDDDPWYTTHKRRITILYMYISRG